MSFPNRIGLALGSGSARGLAHIGVLRALEEAGIRVTCVAGTSIGALIGAVYASGKLDALATELLAFDWKRVAAFLDPVFPRSGLIDGQRVVSLVRSHVGVSNIEDLPVPFCAVATDIQTGVEAIIKTGDLIDAVRASISVPGILTPVRLDGRVLVDGGLVNPVPVNAARNMGADFVIAVDLNHDIVTGRLSRHEPSAQGRAYGNAVEHLLQRLRSSNSPALAQFTEWLRKEPLPGIFEVLLGALSIMQAQITRINFQNEKPDLTIRPPLGAMRFMDFDRAEEIIDVGYRSAVEELTAFSRRGTLDYLRKLTPG